MSPKTQSVCKHCTDLDRQFAHLKSANTGAWQYRNEHGHWVTCETQRYMSEPASTGEPESICPICESTESPHAVGISCNLAARPSEPSAPETSAEDEALPREAAPILAALFNSLIEQNCPDSVSGYTIFDAMWPKIQAFAAPQPVSGDAPGIKVTIYDPIAYLRELYADMGKRGECEICLKLDFCIKVLEEKLVDPAPSPTPSVSTTQERLLKIADEIEQWANARQKTLPSRGDWNRWPTMIRECAAAPSVAGTQPHLRHRIADLLKIASSSEGGPSEDAVFDYVKALAGAAQGTLQVEEISREIAEKLAAMHLIVWQGLGQAIHEYAKEAAAILRKHLAGAPAQPGPDFKKVRNIWPVINRYRGLLIDRKLAGAITQDELTFLDSLQIFADWYLEAVVPRDASELEKLEAIVAAPALATPEPPKVEELPIADWRLEQIKQIRAYGLQAEPTALLLAIDDLLQALRPYFPPASQTPDFSQLVSIWPAINRFRGQLIDRKISGRLENGDRDILDALQVFADWYLEAVVPRDTSVLEKLEQKLATPASTARTDGWVSVANGLPDDDSDVYAAIAWTHSPGVRKYVIHDCSYYEGGTGSGQKIFADCEGEEFEAKEVDFWIYKYRLAEQLPEPAVAAQPGDAPQKEQE